MLAAGALTFASAAYGQVIEEGGFPPVKGGAVSGEPFSLSCPSRLLVQTGESVLLSCSATAVPEEGVRYEWESLSGDGFHLLSASDELSPLFTAPLPGEGEEYVYRLTAMAPGVYETATVTVVARGVPGGYVQDRSKSPGLLEACNSFGALDEGYGEGCVAGDKMPPPFEPFEGGPEGEGGSGFLFPEPFGIPEKEYPGSLRAGEPGLETAPVLECPSAVFLDELETGSIECHVFDASGEDFLEYVWEPVGGTTRDYLDNPRLIPEDTPNPSVVAPEAPGYERLEDARSGETSVRYRYRLTATSRATGLSSWSEVDVFVSGSRPSVYCPSEVEVAEGGSIVLGCEGVDPLFRRMDYDEASAGIAWEWEGLWGTSTALLDATDMSSPLFLAPPGSAGEEYHYVASMTSSASGVPRTARRKVTVIVTAEEEGTQAAADASALANKGRVPVITCNDATLLDILPYPFGEEDEYELDCSVTEKPAGATYSWAGDELRRLTRTDSLEATFDVPDITTHNKAQQTRDYDYTVTLSAPDMDDDVKGVVTIKVKERQVICWVDETTKLEQFYNLDVDEGGSNLPLETCKGGITSAEGGPYTYNWRGRNEHALGEEAELLTATDRQNVSFKVPSDLPRETQYNFQFSVFRASEPDTDNYDETGFRITVNNLDPVECNDPPGFVYEESPPFAFDCTDKGTLSGVTWEWGPPSLLTHLMHTDGVTPTFTPPELPTPYEKFTYTVTARVNGADIGGSEVTVQVLATPQIRVECDNPFYNPYEGADDFVLDCSASGGHGGPDYDYVWTGRGSTTNTDKLSDPSRRNPTFYVPDNVDADQTYEYTLTVSAENAVDGIFNVTVKVLNKSDIIVTCPGDPYSAYEGEGNIVLDCEATGKPSDSEYVYAWTPRGSTPNTDNLIAGTDGPTPTFDVPEEVDEDETYEYTLTVSAENAIDAEAAVTVKVLNLGSIALICASPPLVYEGSEDFALDCTVSGAPVGSEYVYVWTGRGSTVNTDLLTSGTDGPTPTFAVPDALDATTTYEYLLTVSAENAESASAAVTVTVLNHGALSVVCVDPPSVYEGSEDFALDCSASGAPSGSEYDYVWTARDSTANTDQLSATDISSPTFYVPDEVDEDETYEYLLTASADNAEDGTVEVTVNVIDNLPLAFVDDSISGRVYVFTVGEVIADILLPEATGGLFPYTHILTPLLPRGLSLKKGIIYKSCQRAS